MKTDIERKGEERPARLWDWFDAPEFGRWFEGLQPWSRFREDRMRIEQELTDDVMMIRAEMPGIDPAKDVEITVADGVLHIRAERRSEKTAETAGRMHSEFHYGSFERAVRVPKDMNTEDVTATYTNGILEVRFPYKVPTEAKPRKVTVSTS